MKKRIVVLILVIAVFVSCFVACNVGDKSYTVSYLVDGNGTIQGETVQELKTGEKTSEVMAVPDEGYQFVKWSDEYNQSYRMDTVSKNNVTYTAIFEKCVYSVVYRSGLYGFVEGETDQKIEHGGSATTVIAVPATNAYRFVKWEDTGSTDPMRTDTNIRQNISAKAIFELKVFDFKAVTYLTDGGGTIDGRAEQSVRLELDAAPVKAIPNDGYEFIKWSDGVTTAERQDLYITADMTVTAQFKRIYVRFKLDYKLGEADTETTEFIFYDNDFKTVEFPVPTREYFTFGGWYVGDMQVTDTNGTMIIGNELLESAEREIYAKWTANETYTYKILMVYVTELDATIPSVKGNGNFDVYYKMSDFDIEICKTITKQMNFYLNDMLDGLVKFEIDEHFTNVPVGSESITNSSVVNFIRARDIPEIFESGLNKDYQSILTVFCMDDYDYEFRTAAGAASNKYGTVYLETVYKGCMVNKEPLVNLLNLNFWKWKDIIETFIHELAHTIEDQMYDSYEYHKIISWAHNQLMYDHLLMNKLYYLNMIEIDGNKVGIPIEFWKGELELRPVD